MLLIHFLLCATGFQCANGKKSCSEWEGEKGMKYNLSWK